MKNKMKVFIKNRLLKLIQSNKVISIDEAIEYLDYVDKIRYSEEEVNVYLNDLQEENEIYFKNNLWYKS